MSVPTASRIARVLGYEGAVATLLLTVFQYFAVSASFVACLTPVLVFQALVGWQGTHLALWLGAGSLITLAPAIQALVVSSSRLLEHGVDARAGRAFWRALADAARTRWGASLAVVAGALLLGYDVALLGADGATLLTAAAIVAVAVAVLICTAFAVAGGSELRGTALAIAAGRIVLLRPHLALVWLLLTGLATLATTVPIIGAVAWLFAPALAAVAADICNRTLGLAGALERVQA